MANTKVQLLIREFGAGIGAPDLALDKYGACSLVVDDMIVNMETGEEGEDLLLHAVVGEIPEASAEFYEMLLQADFFLKETAGATLGISRAANIVALAYRLSLAEIDLDRFHRVMENFINMVEFWTQRIAGYQGSGSSTAATMATPDMMA